MRPPSTRHQFSGFCLAAAVAVIVVARPSLARSRDAALEAHAARLLQAQRFVELDRLLRGLLDSEDRRDEAARLLRTLDDVPGYEPPIDQAAVDQSRSQLGRGFRQMASRHFIVLTDSDQAWSRERIHLLERAYDQFFRYAGRLEAPVSPPEHKLICVLIEDHDAYSAFARAHDGVDVSWIAGYYASQSNRVVFYNDLTGPSFAEASDQIQEHRRSARNAERRAAGIHRARGDESSRAALVAARQYIEKVETRAVELRQEAASVSRAKTIHECIHLLSFNCGLQSRARQYPLWLTEGLASCFETNDPRRRFGPRAVNPDRDDTMRELIEADELTPLDEFVRLNHVPSSADDDPASARAAYAQSASFFAWCDRYERTALRGYLEDLLREPAGLISTRRHGEMFERRFGDPHVIERQWLRDEEHRLRAD